MRKCARHHDERVGRANKEAVLFQCAHLRAQFCNLVTQVALSYGRGGCKRILIFRAFQRILRLSEVRIGSLGFLWPAITGERFEICRRASAYRHPISIGTVSVHVHVCLEHERFSVTLRMLKLQHSLAVEEIVP